MKYTTFPMMAAGILALVIQGAARAGFTDNFNNGTIDSPWQVVQNGGTIQETGGVVHITGVTNQTTWAGNGIHTGFVFPNGDFTATVQFKTPTFSGTGGAPLTYLQVNSESGNMIGIFYDYPYGLGYRLQSWDVPTQQFGPWLNKFGDETTAFHTMTLQYTAATATVTGNIDGSSLGSLNISGQPLVGKLDYYLEGVTDRSGMNMDISYD